MVSNKGSQAKAPLTLAQLASYDDIITDTMIDHVSHRLLITLPLVLCAQQTL
jgi:hypothetical protein